MAAWSPRGRFERLDVVLAARIWRTDERADSPVAATCRNLSARGCRFWVEDARLIPGLDLESPVQFSIQLEPARPEITGGGRVVWLKKERGEAGKIRVILGLEYISVSFADRERIKGYIASHAA